MDIITFTTVSKELSISKKSHTINVILYCCNSNKKSLISSRTQSRSKLDLRRHSIPNVFKFKAWHYYHIHCYKFLILVILYYENCWRFVILLNLVKRWIFRTNSLTCNPILFISGWISIYPTHQSEPDIINYPNHVIIITLFRNMKPFFCSATLIQILNSFEIIIIKEFVEHNNRSMA